MNRLGRLVLVAAVAVAGLGVGVAFSSTGPHPHAGRVVEVSGADQTALARMLATTTAGTLSGTTPLAGSRRRAAAGSLRVQVYFGYAPAFAAHQQPYVRPVLRTVRAADPLAGALRALALGPTAAERARGLVGIPWPHPSFTRAVVDQGAATVQIGAGCVVDRSVPVAEMVQATVQGIAGVGFVKIFDAAGDTEQRGYDLDSIPPCLNRFSGRTRYLNQQYQG